jgi:RNA ligase (TIGR02306 family)
MNEGDSVVEYYNLQKRVYEEELPELPEKGSQNNTSPPKTFTLHKYDLEGLAKYGYVFQEGEEVIISEKLEGENYTMIYAEDQLWCKSRNYFKKNDPDSHWWEIPRRMNLEEKLKDYPGLAIVGELYGNVKGWHYDVPIIDNRFQRKFRVFDIWDIKFKRFMEWSDVEKICAEIGLETVPVLYKGPWKTDRSLHCLAEGKSTIGNCVREGFVMRSVPESWHEKLGRKIIKLKGRDYKLAKG